MDIYLINILFSIVGLFFFTIAAFLFKKKRIDIMTNHEDNKRYYEKKLLTWLISSFLLAGVFIIIFSILNFYFPFINSTIIFGLIICLLAIAIGIGFSKYEID